MYNCMANPRPCTGCGACKAVCPAGAVRLVLNQEGFWEAQADEAKCIRCQKCISVCPKFTEHFPAAPLFDALPLYAVCSKNPAEQATSSSGGAGAEIIAWAFANGYKAAGVVYNYQRQCAETVIAENPQEAACFKGSKYLQSECAGAFEQILKRKDKLVVFGSPCQIAALHLAASLTGRRKDLILVDFFCHGVPSYFLWKSFLRSFPQKIQQLRFRHKQKGWHCYTMEINGAILPQEKNPFYTLFFSDLLLGAQCYDCESRRSFAFADIRLGDFWASAFDMREDGVSAFCAITPKGQNVFDSLKDKLHILPVTQIHHLCRRNQQAFAQAKPLPAARRKMLAMLAGPEGLKRTLQYYKATRPWKKRMADFVKRISPHGIKRILRKRDHQIMEKS